MGKTFNFDLYRLNIVDVQDLFVASDAHRLRTDDEIINVIQNSSSPDYDLNQETRTAIYKWSIRDFCEYPAVSGLRRIVSVVLARSVLEKEGLIVTDSGITQGSSSPTPPLANTVILLFDMSRHLVAVEHSGILSQTAWRDFIAKIFSNAASACDKASFLELEPVPEKHEIISLFRSFERLTRIKAVLRIPNPELTRYTKALFEDLQTSQVREYEQDMRNPNGLSKEENARPYATAALAEQGYKDGDVQMEGIRGGEFEKVVSGSTATRGSITSLKDFVRGLHANAKAKETQNVLTEVVREIDRIHPPEAGSEA